MRVVSGLCALFSISTSKRIRECKSFSRRWEYLMNILLFKDDERLLKQPLHIVFRNGTLWELASLRWKSLNGISVVVSTSVHMCLTINKAVPDTIAFFTFGKFIDYYLMSRRILVGNNLIYYFPFYKCSVIYPLFVIRGLSYGKWNLLFTDAHTDTHVYVSYH